MKILRLILGDQLNSTHSWFSKTDSDITYLMAEMRQETDYVIHHIQKVMAFFDAMRIFAQELQNQGHKVKYYSISDPANPQILDQVIRKEIQVIGADRFEYQLPDEYRLNQQLLRLCSDLNIPSGSIDTEHFYTSRTTLSEFFSGKKQLLMESFYRMMRRRHGVLMQGDLPTGGQWNFDHDNRKKWTGTPPLPPLPLVHRDLSDLESEIRKAGITTLGEVNSTRFNWPTSRTAALELLDHFCKQLLPYFGSYQDAMHSDEPFLFHSRLSFALNAKLISPKEVVTAVAQTHLNNPDCVHISQAEGYVRQILGWREYMRGIYWKEMPQYATLNRLENYNTIPAWYWTGNTKMNCLKQAIGQSLKHAYAHHIQRLMITGNFALLLQVHPDQVDAWYLGIYIDAVEWVEITNTRGMSQFADGGLLSTKPYISSANYIRNMSNYCHGCSYNSKETLGEQACPFNALYWNFLNEKRTQLSRNPRMTMMYRLLDKKDAVELAALKDRAAAILANPNNF
ncbi:MAG: hypothetical protein RLZZ241_1622 [Bacteroidota bacterium]|jgi:deoxyribodipyrimidine photolyase-related protein